MVIQGISKKLLNRHIGPKRSIPRSRGSFPKGISTTFLGSREVVMVEIKIVENYRTVAARSRNRKTISFVTSVIKKNILLKIAAIYSR